MTTTRKPLIAGNWKMNAGGSVGVDLAESLATGFRGSEHVDMLIAPPFTIIHSVSKVLQNSQIQLAAQNLHFAPKGAFTGEVSASMVRQAGARWAIIGHSERRHVFGETDEVVAKKTQAALDAGLNPIVCVGETLEQRDAGETLKVVTAQLAAVGPCLDAAGGHLVVAYEPVWAIGTGRTATPAQAEEVHLALRSALGERTKILAQETRILYGGSVKPATAPELLACPNVDGCLVGGASLKADSFLAIAAAATPSSLENHGPPP